MQTGLEGKPWWYGAMVGGLLAAVVVVGLYMLKFKPMKEQIAGLRTQRAQLEQKIQEGHNAEERLPQLQERVAGLEQELLRLKEIMPDRLNTQQILRTVRSLCETGDFALKVFEPSQRLIEKEFYLEWPIVITLDGSYHNLAIFFDTLAGYKRLFNIEDLRINALQNQRGSHSLSTSFTAKTFVMVDPPQPETPKEPS